MFSDHAWGRQSMSCYRGLDRGARRELEVRLTVAHVEDALDLSSKVSVPWRVNDVDLCALHRESQLQPLLLMPHSSA